jgi:hypothetical protein
MAEKPTEKNCYQSIFSPGSWINFCQFMAEKACSRAAAKEYKELPLKFWQIKRWANQLKFQISNCSKLQKQYRDDAILAAFNDKRCRTVFSLNAPWFIKVIEEYQATEAKEQPKVEIVEVEEIQSVRPTTGGNNLASLLD